LSQDYTVDCFATDHQVQTDMLNIEKNFECLRSTFSGSAAPSNIIAGMWWFDTNTNILKLRNEANSAWLNIWDFANNKPCSAFRNLGTGAADACAGNDSRLSNQRVPTSASVSQSKLKTSTGSVNTTGTSWVNRTLPGGSYGFFPQVKQASGAETYTYISHLGSVSTSYTTNVTMRGNNGVYAYAQQRYITSSGEVFWIFLLRNKTTKEIEGMYQAPDHPCFGNGGKPLLISHPFGDYDTETQEIIVINPTNEEVEQMELETIVEDELEPDKDLLEVITENYEIDESSNPAWPTKPVTVGLPKFIIDKETGKKKLADYRFMNKDDVVTPIKKVIPQLAGIICKSLKKKGTIK